MNSLLEYVEKGMYLLFGILGCRQEERKANMLSATEKYYSAQRFVVAHKVAGVIKGRASSCTLLCPVGDILKTEGSPHPSVR